MDRLSTLRNEAAEVATRIEALAALDSDNKADIDARNLELSGLTEKAKSLSSQIDFEAKVAESVKDLRSVAERCSPAPEVRDVATRVEPVRYGRRLRAFGSAEEAYRCGQWIAGTFLGNADAKRWCLDHGVEARAGIMGEATNSAGGFAVPEEFSAAIIRNVETYGVAPGVMQNATMTSDTILFPKRLTGVTANWVGENVEITTSNPTGTQVQLVAKKLAVGTRVSNELLSDSVISIADWLVQEFSLELAKRIDEAVFNGTGTSAFGGIHGIVPKIDVAGSKSVVGARTNNNAVEKLDLGDFSKALAALPRYALQSGNAAWYMSPAVYHASVERLQLSTGTGATSAASGGNNRNDLAAGALPRFLGLPVVQVLVMDSKVDDDSGKVKVLVGDAALAGIYGVRQLVTVRSSVDEYARFDQTAWYATLRVDANWHSLGDAAEAGPMVALKTA
jgi:HK97 family phage major capsid protein